MSKGKYRKCSLRQNVEKKKHVKGKYRKENIEGKRSWWKTQKRKTQKKITRKENVEKDNAEKENVEEENIEKENVEKENVEKIDLILLMNDKYYALFIQNDKDERKLTI